MVGWEDGWMDVLFNELTSKLMIKYDDQLANLDVRVSL